MKSRIEPGQFFLPSPDDDVQADGERKQGGGRPSAQRIKEEVTVLKKDFKEGGLIDTLEYASQAVRLTAAAMDAEASFQSHNREVADHYLDGKAGSLENMQEQFLTGKMASVMAVYRDEVSVGRALVSEVAGSEFAHVPFLRALTFKRHGKPLAKLTPVQYRIEKTRMDLRNGLYADILKGPGATEEEKKKKGLLILTLASSLVKEHLESQVSALLEKTPTILPRAEEEYWSGKLVGRPGSEGILFCKEYLKRSREQTEKLDSKAISVLRFFEENPTPGDARMQSLRKRIIASLVAGEWQETQALLKQAGAFKYYRPLAELFVSKEEIATQHAGRIAALSLAHEKQQETARQRVGEKELAKEKSMERLRRANKHVFLNLSSVAQGDSYAVCYLTQDGEEAFTSVNFNYKEGEYKGTGGNLAAYSQNFASKIEVGDSVNASFAEQGPFTVYYDAPLRVVAGGKTIYLHNAFLDLGEADDFSPDAIHARVKAFLETDLARALWKEKLEAIRELAGEYRAKVGAEPVEKEDIEPNERIQFLKQFEKHALAQGVRSEGVSGGVIYFLERVDVEKSELDYKTFWYHRTPNGRVGGELKERTRTSNPRMIYELLKKGDLVDSGEYSVFNERTAHLAAQRFEQRTEH